MAINKIIKTLVICLVAVMLDFGFIAAGNGSASAASAGFHTSAKTVSQTNVTPSIGWANCSSGANGGSGWFTAIDNNGNKWCLGGGGYEKVTINSVAEVSTGNNWGHYEYSNGYTQYFSYYQYYYPNYQTIIGVWLYE